MDGLCADLAERGWAAANLEYRRVGADGGGWPMTFDDVRAGIDALTMMDGLPLDRIVTIGHSAGGHLALWAASATGAVTDVVSLAGVTDLEQAHRLGLSSDATGSFLGGTPSEFPSGTPPRRRWRCSRWGCRRCSCTAIATRTCPSS